jgi:hypothetical protein
MNIFSRADLNFDKNLLHHIEKCVYFRRLKFGKMYLIKFKKKYRYLLGY